MKQCKRFLLLCIAVLFVFTLFGCGGSKEHSSQQSEAEMRETYRQVYGKMSDLLIGVYAGDSQPSAAVLRSYGLYSSVFVAENEIYTEQVTGSTWFIAATTYVYLASELYQNDTFVITDKPVGYTVAFSSSETSEAQVDIVMMSNMNVKTGKVLLQLEFETKEYTGAELTHSEKNYIYINADYDFAKKEIETMLMHIWRIDQSKLILSAKYSGEVFKHMNELYLQQVCETVAALRTEYESKFGGKVQLGDYTPEYERANEYMKEKLNEIYKQQ